MSIGKNLKNLRDKQGLTQDELSLKSGVSQSHISDIEGDRKAPTIKVLNKLTKALRCNTGDINKLKS